MGELGSAGGTLNYFIDAALLVLCVRDESGDILKSQAFQ